MTRKDNPLPKTYRIRINGQITDSKLSGLRKGIYINNIKHTPITITVETTSNTMSWISITTTEPSISVIKNILIHMHWNITRIICTGYGPYRLGQLAPGEIRPVEVGGVYIV